MTSDQALTALRLADGLPKVIGAGCTFKNGAPCCSIGHMAAALGVKVPDTEVWWTPTQGVRAVEAATGLSWANVFAVNDTTAPSMRRAEVIREVEYQVRAAGFDPQTLRASNEEVQQ